MLQDDRDDDKYEGSDEPEYHFSDEEGGDYVDPTETPKETTPSTDESGSRPAAGGVTALAPSKRMMISLVVFLVLVFVVYKMVAPTTQPVPSTEIAAAPAQTAKPVETAKMQQNVPMVAMPAPNASAPMTPPTPTQAMQAPMQQQAAPPISQPAQPAAPVSAQSIVSNVTNAMSAMQGQIMQQAQQAVPSGQQPLPTQQGIPQPPINTQPVVVQQQPMVQPSSQPMMQAQAPMPQQPVTQPPMMQVAPPVQPTTMTPPPVAQPMMAQQAPQASPGITGMPSVIPVASPTPSVPPASSLNPMANDSRIVALQGDSSRLMNQLQSDYVEKLNDFSTQNKALQDEIQTLNSRMSAMEGQINQLVQALTRQQVPGGSMNEPPPVEQPPVVIDQKTSYNVQAIIPGRAWLRTENGETLTVAEGDVIKSLGRVTKIDPYDGVVEINTGNKVVSLSYGTAA